MDSKDFLNFKSSYMSQLALSDSFEHLRYESTVIINIVLFQCGDRL